MLEHLTPHSVAAGIRMMRSGASGVLAFLVVEGPTDSRLFGKFVDRTCCDVVVAGNKEKALQVLQILESDNFDGVACVVDSDFWALLGIKPASQNILVTDAHDILCSILISPALDSVLAELGSPGKLRAIKNSGRSVRTILFQTASYLGALRLCSEANSYRLTFNGLSHDEFVKDTLIVDIPDMIERVRQLSRFQCPPHEQLRFDLDATLAVCHPLTHLCSGHDVVKVLAIALRDLVGSLSGNDAKPARIEQLLRIAFSAAHFAGTTLYQDMRAWEVTNSPYRLLA